MRYARQLVVRISDDEHAELLACAELDDRTVAWIVRRAIRQYLDERDASVSELVNPYPKGSEVGGLLPNMAADRERALADAKRRAWSEGFDAARQGVQT